MKSTLVWYRHLDISKICALSLIFHIVPCASIDEANQFLIPFVWYWTRAVLSGNFEETLLLLNNMSARCAVIKINLLSESSGGHIKCLCWNHCFAPLAFCGIVRRLAACTLPVRFGLSRQPRPISHSSLCVSRIAENCFFVNTITPEISTNIHSEKYIILSKETGELPALHFQAELKSESEILSLKWKADWKTSGGKQVAEAWWISSRWKSPFESAVLNFESGIEIF